MVAIEEVAAAEAEDAEVAVVSDPSLPSAEASSAATSVAATASATTAAAPSAACRFDSASSAAAAASAAAASAAPASSPDFRCKSGDSATTTFGAPELALQLLDLVLSVLNPARNRVVNRRGCSHRRHDVEAAKKFIHGLKHGHVIVDVSNGMVPPDIRDMLREHTEEWVEAPGEKLHVAAVLEPFVFEESPGNELEGLEYRLAQRVDVPAQKHASFFSPPLRSRTPHKANALDIILIVVARNSFLDLLVDDEQRVVHMLFELFVNHRRV